MQYTSRAAQLYRQQLTKDSAKLTALAAADAVSDSAPLPAPEPAASNGAAAAPAPAENGSAAASSASAAAAAPVAAAPAPGEEPVYARFTFVLLREGWMRVLPSVPVSGGLSQNCVDEGAADFALAA